VQASVTSASTFAVGAAVPILAALAPGASGIVLTVVVSMVALATLGAVGAALGGAPRLRAAWRVLAGGALAMAVTAAIGGLVGISGL
jgi:VIT1/CCC1 family predicted Fe2+/Mn2+ transporter